MAIEIVQITKKHQFDGTIGPSTARQIKESNDTSYDWQTGKDFSASASVMGYPEQE